MTTAIATQKTESATERNIMDLSEIQVEQTDEIPLLIFWLQRMKIAETIDANIPTPHGNRKGLSYGQLALLLICYQLYERNHVLSKVEEWVQEHLQVLEHCCGFTISPKDCTDDRLADMLRQVGLNTERVCALHEAHSPHIVQAFKLPTDLGRYDTTSHNTYHNPDANNSAANGLFRYGFSKDKRPDLLQIKQGFGVLGDSGVPIFSEVINGNEADDPQYLPAWRSMTRAIGHSDFLFIGDSKAASKDTRRQLNQEGGTYLFPVPKTGKIPEIISETILNPVDIARTEIPINHVYSNGQKKRIATAFEEIHWEEDQGEIWQERRLFCQSLSHAHSQRKALQKRLKLAKVELTKIGQKACKNIEKSQAKVDAIVQKYNLDGCFEFEWIEEDISTKKYLQSGRPGKDSPFENIKKTQYWLDFSSNEEEIKRRNELAGWRIFVTNTDESRLPLEKAISDYRNEWEVEMPIRNSKNRPLSVSPMWLRTDTHIRGLMFLVTICLQVLSLIEFSIQNALKDKKKTLKGLVPGNPQRETNRPTADRIFRAMRCINVFVIHTNSGVQLKLERPLSDLQLQILELLNIPRQIYEFS